ncbi:MAG: acyltransferase 3 [Tardiphaga sp.]|uniref:acyltransferase family protein n=1 Tax=Tardiphaga sp. TaxID=1926292 RepID=UPI002617E6A2|nr:acyltransferase family protein [Tardiphaga sp.]MDB5501461.1 acyltransferase 3 [Tardiphaga sp.]
MTNSGTFAVADRAALSGSPAITLPERIDWVDYAKGICIVMVVMMHSVLGVELAAGQTGFMHGLVAFAKPFRMPDFFLISGLFLSRVIDRDWRTYLDRKVVHFVYFYVLWVTIQFAFKAPGLAAEHGSWGYVAALYLESYIEPFGTLWFIYMLPVFFVLTKALRRVPPCLVWSVAALLEMVHVATGWTMIDEFSARFVYFYSGYLFATRVFALSDRARSKPVQALAGLAVWAVVNAALVYDGCSEWPVLSLMLGFAGAVAIVMMGTLLAKMQWLGFLRFCGEHSIVIYLAFFLPMAAARALLLKFAPLDIGTISLLVTLSGLVGALALWRLALAAHANFLFERPEMFWIAPRKKQPELQPAE